MMVYIGATWAPSRGHELEANDASGIPLDEPRSAGALDDGADRGCRVIDELHHRGARAHLYHAADESLRHDHRGLLGHPAAAASIHGDGTHPATGLATDDLAGHGRERQTLAQLEKAPQSGVFLLGLRALEPLHPQALGLGAQRRILTAHPFPIRVGRPDPESARDGS